MASRRRSRLCGELCKQVEARIVGAVPHCTKRAPLCWRVDPRLTELRPGETLEVYDELQQTIHVGHIAARYEFDDNPLPQTEAEWIWRLQTAHGEIFRTALPDHAGCFREHPAFYGHHQHERAGTEPGLIESELFRLFEDLVAPEALLAIDDQRSFCRWAAHFLPRFFRIHPFVDGNGRIARLWISRVAFETIECDLAQSMNSRCKTRYRQSLQFAHRCYEERRAGGWGPLASWVLSMLVPVVEEEATPPVR